MILSRESFPVQPASREGTSFPLRIPRARYLRGRSRSQRSSTRGQIVEQYEGAIRALWDLGGLLFSIKSSEMLVMTPGKTSSVGSRASKATIVARSLRKRFIGAA